MKSIEELTKAMLAAQREFNELLRKATDAMVQAKKWERRCIALEIKAERLEAAKRRLEDENARLRGLEDK